ncbi:MAG: GH3 auxin-responsive promoter family protein, partial [Pseudomonadota bacterium]
MYYLGSIVTWFVRQRTNNLRQMIENPLDTQWNTFRYLLSTAADTEWGKQYDFDSIKTYEDFKNRIPVQDYDSLKPFIDRIMEGEQNILWSTPVKWFAKSSGTTNDVSKFIPMTRESIEDCHFKAGIDVLTMFCNTYENTNIFSGKGLILGGSHQINQLNQYSSYGDLSAVLLQNMSFFAQRYRTPELSIALMNDWEKKVEHLANATINENVTNISGVPTWTIVLIKRLFEKTGKSTLKEIWPGLELYIHGGVSFTPYRDQFKTLAGDSSVKFVETYNASEGFFAFQDNGEETGMLLHTNAGILYEFIPQSDWHKEHPETLILHEVKANENYAMVISTNAGLWRYKIGDTVRFTSINPYRIVVSGRVKHFINAFVEEVIVDNAD